MESAPVPGIRRLAEARHHPVLLDASRLRELRSRLPAESQGPGGAREHLDRWRHGLHLPDQRRRFRKNGPPARERVLEGLRVAKAVGATSMRCYIGSQRRPPESAASRPHMESTIQVFRSVRAEALDLGVKIALENHSGDMQAREVKTIIEEAGKDYRGILPGYRQPDVVRRRSIRHAGDAGALRRHHTRPRFGGLRSAAAERRRSGWRWETAAWTSWRFVARFRELCPQSSMQLEIITGRPPTRAAVPRAGFLEGVLQDARLGVRALRRAGQERPSLYGRRW